MNIGTATIDLIRYEQLCEIERAYQSGKVIYEATDYGYIRSFYTPAEFDNKINSENNRLRVENEKLRIRVSEIEKLEKSATDTQPLIKMALKSFILNTSIWQFIKYKTGKS